MPITYDIEKDALYKRGYEKGFKIGFKEGFNQGFNQGFKQVISALKCLKQGKTVNETARLSGLSKNKVQEIKELLS